MILQSDQIPIQVPSFPSEDVDTTAAGDSIVGAFAVSLATGHSLETAVRRGCAAGALAVTRLGAQPSIPTQKQIDDLLKEN